MTASASTAAAHAIGAAIPSVVFGLWALTTAAVLFAPAPGAMRSRAAEVSA